MEINATILVSAISFIVFIFIMNSLLYQPILNIIQERNEYIKNNKNAADEHGKKAQSLIEDKNQKIGEAHKKSRDIVAAKTEAIKEEKNKTVNSTKSEMSSFVNSQKDDLAKQKDEAYYNLKSSLSDLANNITTKLVGEGIAFEPLSESEIDEVIRKNA